MQRINDFINAYDALLPSTWGAEVIASFLLMAHNPISFPIYRAEPMRLAAKLVGWDWPTRPPKAQRLNDSYKFIGEFIKPANASGLVIRDTLDAQSLIWCVTKSSHLPSNWSLEERHQFEAFRAKGGPAGDDLEDDAGPAIQHVWWVNQGQTFQQERAGGYIWAPLRTRAGYGVRHHLDVGTVQEGDAVMHYSNSVIRAVGIANSEATNAQRPEELPIEPWGEQGHMVSIRYQDVNPPLTIEAINSQLFILQPNGGPFTRGAGS